MREGLFNVSNIINNNLFQEQHPFAPTRHKTRGHSGSWKKKHNLSAVLPLTGLIAVPCAFRTTMRTVGCSVISPATKKTTYTPWVRAVTRGTPRFFTGTSDAVLTIHAQPRTMEAKDGWLMADKISHHNFRTVWYLMRVQYYDFDPGRQIVMFLKSSPQLSPKFRVLRVCSHIHNYHWIWFGTRDPVDVVTNIQTVRYLAQVFPAGP